MKRLLFLLVPCLFLIPEVSGMDFTDYPSIINNGTIIINGGVGWDGNVQNGFSPLCPPLSLSMDYALPLATLPFTFGAIFGYSTEASKDKGALHLGMASRIAYHVGLPFTGAKIDKRMDLYTFVTLGAITELYDASWEFWGGLGLGTRYYFIPWFGVYLEGGFDSFVNINGGISFRL
jgi:hypothetical protein